MAIALRKPEEIEKLRRAGAMVGQTLEYLQSILRPGMTLKEVDEAGEEFLRKLGAEPSFKGLYGFPSAVCTSVNEVIIHGIPTDYVLKEGDIIGMDIGSKYDGYYGDAAVTVGIGEVSEEDRRLMNCSRKALDEAIGAIRPQMRFKELSKLLEDIISSEGFVPLRDYCGHGIGTKPHEEPNVPNYLEGKSSQGPKMKSGMVFCIEPMVCQKNGEPKLLDDGWSVLSEDGLRGSHHEHQVAVGSKGAIVLTLP